MTGAYGFLGKYLVNEFSDEAIVTLGLDDRDMIRCDLRETVPQFDRRFDTVVHNAGSITCASAMATNHEGTVRLCRGLESAPPRQFVFISSIAVYGADSGEELGEDTPLRPVNDYGRSKMMAEEFLTQWCADRDVKLTILRPALIIGTGMNGSAAAMARGIDRGYYFHIKDNEARRSVIHAADVAIAARLTAPIGGIYNLSDGVHPTVHDLAEAIAHRLGDKRIMTLPRRTVDMVARLGDCIPLLPLSTARLRQLTETLTVSNAAIRRATPLEPRDVVSYLTTHDYDQATL
ncbi:MAG: NAD-dependent epimerase/dehydratase family protein [Pseudoflavonifractor sp.]|nr:NAD-dependent epimerase/dehydratase family protein [Pseudoflavonifractor sp.]